MTIWIRRVGAVLVGIVFAVVLAGALLMQAVNTTVGRPAFLSDQLERADAYQFVTDDLLTALLDDMRRLDADEFGWEFEENPLVTSGLTTQQITDAVNRALPPEDLEALVGPVVEQAGEYISGEQEEVTLAADADAHLEALVGELTGLFRESGAYARLLDGELTPIFAEWVDEGFPPGEEDSRWVGFLRGDSGEPGGSLVRVFTSVVTPEWMAAQVESAAAELVAYGVGRSDGFDVRIALDAAQVEEVADEIEAIIGEADAYDVAYATVIEPAAEERIGEVVELPYGVALTRLEVLDALRDAVSPDWLEEQAEILSTAVARYVTGDADSFVAVFDVEPAKDRAARALTATAAAALRDALQGLPECSTAPEIATARAALRTELPPCIPPDVTVAAILDLAVPIIASSVKESVLGPVPDTVRYTEEDLRDALEQDGGAEAVLALDDIREFFGEGWTYTDADLRADLADDDAIELVDDLRAILSTGYVIETSDESREGFEGALDGAREAASWRRGGPWVAALIAAVLLVAVAFLGGRSWCGRVAWAAAVLLVVAGVFAIVSGPVYQSVSSTVFDDVSEELGPERDSGFSLTSGLLVDKLLDVVETAADEAVGGIARNSLILAVVAAVALIGSVFWRRIGAATGWGQP